MESSYEKLKAISKYHFNNDIIDPRWDTVIELGQFKHDWTEEVAQIVASSKPATWETRGFKGEGVEVPSEELINEEYDLIQAGVDKDIIITNLAWKLSDSLQKISDMVALGDVMNRIHVQMPGQVWNLHIDKLYKWFPEDPSCVGRYFIQLTDWQPGQFWQYGNFNWSGWKAGNVTTFDWANVPHSTANAGFHPRVTLQITGIITDKTKVFLEQLKNNPIEV
jgi:hypothetical protein